MLALLMGLAFSVNVDPSRLSVPAPDPKEVWIEALHQCENPDNVEKVWDSNHQWSYGKYQWQMRSWLNYKKQGATKDNILDEEMQDKITRYVLDTKGSSDWLNCSRLVSRALGSYPKDR